MKRRDFLKLSGITGAFAAVGCAQDSAYNLIPFLNPPEDIVPGRSTWYASTCRQCPAGCGILARNREARIVKVEGNALHPVNRGRLCARGQALVESQYSPDRLVRPEYRDAGTLVATSWPAAIARFRDAAATAAGSIAVLSCLEEGFVSDQLESWLARHGGGRVAYYEPIAYEALREANRIVFDQDKLASLDISGCDLIVSINVDFLETWLSPVELTRQYTQARKPKDAKGPDGAGQNATFLYAGPRLSMTGASADRWISIKPGTEADLAFAILGAMWKTAKGRQALSAADRAKVGAVAGAVDVDALCGSAGVEPTLVSKIANRIFSAERPFVFADATTDAAVAMNLINVLAGSARECMDFDRSLTLGKAAKKADLDALLAEMNAGRVRMLVCHRTNPAYSLPGFAEAAAKVRTVVVLDYVTSETKQLAGLVLPINSPYESWGTYSPRKGVVGMVQPTMGRFVESWPLETVLAEPGTEVGPKTLHIAYAAAVAPKLGLGGGYGAAMRETLGKGVCEVPVEKPQPIPIEPEPDPEPEPAEAVEFADAESTESAPDDAVVDGEFVTAPDPEPEPVFLPPPDPFAIAIDGYTYSPTPTPKEALAVVAYPSIFRHDGSQANNAWMLETPDPITNITWGDWVEVHPDTARKKGLEEGDVVELSVGGKTARLPVHVYGTAGPLYAHEPHSAFIHPDALGVPVGLGHAGFGALADSCGGVNLWTLTGGPATVRGVKMTRTGERSPLAHTDGKKTQYGYNENRHIIRVTHEKGDAYLQRLAEMHEDASAKKAADGADGTSGRPPAHPPTHAPAVAPVESHGGGGADPHGGEHAEGGHHGPGVRLPIASAVDPEFDIYPPIEHGQDPKYAQNYTYGRYRWGMLIDLDKCTGCGACVAACYAENNVPPVGRERILEGREMSWIHVERYYEPALAAGVLFLPMMCQHCNNAPCETVCPVYAPHHNQEGLNVQIYNRCVGTRYCSQNCPYKVRRFNFFTYKQADSLDMQYNPDVTVRNKGVMEKCSFCVQRIKEAHQVAKNEKRKVADGEVVPACAQTCPAGAITFGNYLDDEADSRVLQLFKAEKKRAYQVLDELNTVPGVIYLKKIIRDDGLDEA